MQLGNNPYDGDPTGGSGGGGTTITYPLAVTTSALPGGAVGAAYDQFLNASGGTGSYTWAITAGALPAGLVLAATGEITGKPTAAGTTYFVAQVTDSSGSTASANLALSIPSQPTISNYSLPSCSVGVPYTGALQGAGGAPPYTFAIVAGALPPGLTLASTGGITGTPTVAGSYPVQVSITDSGSPKSTSTATYVITINRANLAASVRSLDACVLLGCADGALYMVVPNQKHDEAYDGTPVGIWQEWDGVPTVTSKLGLMRVGGCTVSARGNGFLNVSITSNEGDVHVFSTPKRPMQLTATEMERDFLGKAIKPSSRYAPRLHNGGVVDAWFEVHVFQLWMQAFAGQRKA